MRSRVHKKSVIWIIIGVVIYMVLLTGLAVFFTSNSRSSMEEMLKHEMVDVAKSAAASIDGDMLDEIVNDNKNTESFKTIYDRLSIFLNKTNAKYIYAVRKMNGDVYSFVLDTDPNDPAFYGEPIERTDELVEAYQGTPPVEADVHSDRWGHFYTAYYSIHFHNNHPSFREFQLFEDICTQDTQSIQTHLGFLSSSPLQDMTETSLLRHIFYTHVPKAPDFCF